MLSTQFYQQAATEVAIQLLGKYLVYKKGKIELIGRINETEAYTSDDPASQTFNGQTKRNSVLFGPAGHLYVYMTYGMHFCINVVTGKAGVGEGVLIRSVQPIKGLLLPCDGPAKLTKAYGLTLADNGLDLTAGPLTIEEEEIKILPRVGISKNKDALLRFKLERR